MWEDKTKVSQNLLFRKLKSGEQVSVMSYDSSKSAILLFWFFYRASFISLRASQWFKSQWKDRSYFAVFSIFKVLGIYSLKIHNWHGFFILVKRYYTFLHLKPQWRGQFYFNKFETLFYIRTLDCLNVWRTSPKHVSCVHLLL